VGPSRTDAPFPNPFDLSKPFTFRVGQPIRFFSVCNESVSSNALMQSVHDYDLAMNQKPAFSVVVRAVQLALSASLLLTGCVVRVAAPPPPPPPRVYTPPPAPPPPPEPVVEEDVQAAEAPPPLPDYDQPACPGDGYLWTPGYWRWYGGGYYWVPGTWVMPPRVGVLWTPPYWGFVGGVYVFHAGYWGPHVGFYGGVHYGYGYVGMGFAGGHWAGNAFAYNTSVTNVNTTIVHNTYNVTVVNNVTVNKVSYNGGAGGVTATPTAQERAATQESHVPPTPMQRQHVQQAVKSPALAARANGGHPSIAATARPAAFQGPGVVGARGSEMQSHAPAVAHNSNGSAPGAQRGPTPQQRQQAKAAKQPHPNGPQKGQQQKRQHDDRSHEPQR
jgi:hypothetical protein